MILLSTFQVFFHETLYTNSRKYQNLQVSYGLDEVPRDISSSLSSFMVIYLNF